MSMRIRRTKIVTTLGPATDLDNNLEKIIVSGANIVRLNFSHGNAEDHLFRAKKTREIAARIGRHVAILGDLQGPKIRISTFNKGKIFLNNGDKFILDATMQHGQGNNEVVGIDYKNLPNDLISGDILLLDDGRIQLKVLKIYNMKVYTEVTVGGLLSNNKGINKLGGGLSAESLTEKDKNDILIAAQIGIDYLAISFPRTGKDINYARKLARDAGSYAKIVAKIERAEAVISDDVMDNIILAADVVMVARGDLGVEIGDPELVCIQKKLINRARTLNRAVITATQMMESMIFNPMPTRAEVMDVANAVLDGTDAVMLSAETATGRYPVETVLSMSNVCLGAEKINNINFYKHILDMKFNNIEDAIAISAMYTANHLKGITAIISMTESGRTALIMSRISSGIPIFAMSPHENTLNITALYRGVTPIKFITTSEGVIAAKNATNILCNKGYLVTGDLVLITQGDVMDMVGTTNTIRIIRVD